MACTTLAVCGRVEIVEPGAHLGGRLLDEVLATGIPLEIDHDGVARASAALVPILVLGYDPGI